MSTISPTSHRLAASARERARHDQSVPPSDWAFRYVAAAIRLCIGWVFLWAFLDKLLGLGHETASKAAWVNGGHPTFGFLKLGTTGPFAGFYKGFAGATWADWSFMLGLFAIGVGLMAGIAMGLSVIAGVTMLVLMWSAALPPANNLFMDEHIIYGLTLVALLLAGAGRTLGFGRRWEQLAVVRKNRWLS